MRKILAGMLFLSISFFVRAQREPDMVYANNIKSIKFFRFGDPVSYPYIGLNSSDQLELHFDDMDADVKYYYYTLEMRNADWSPVQLSYFDVVRGFTQQRINTYRVSAANLSRYTHYQVNLPDKNLMPIKSGNYVLKVFENGDTSKLAFTRRLLVVDSRITVGAQVQQPFSQQFFRTHHRLLVQLGTKGFDLRYPQQQIKLNILQNNRWDNALMNIQPTFIKQDQLEFNTESQMLFPAMREWRWLNLRSFRLLGDRVAAQRNTNQGFDVLVSQDQSRSGTPYYFFQDRNGMFFNETVERINPYWEADFGKVNFSFATPSGMPYQNGELFVFGELTDYGRIPEAKMSWDERRNVYVTQLNLKQGYYNYVFAIKNPDNQVFQTDLTEGNAWETENSYMILVYYRDMGGRYDQLLGFRIINSQFNRPNQIR